jgi:hypothetical protein
MIQFLICFFIAGTQLQASPQTQILPMGSSSISTMNIVRKGAWDPEKFQLQTMTLKAEFSEIQKMISPGLVFPIGLTVDFYSTYEMAQWASEDKTLKIGASNGAFNDESRASEFNAAINNHELGHAILDENLKLTNPFWQNGLVLRGTMVRAENHLKQLKLQFDELQRKIEQTPEGSENEKLSEDLQAIVRAANVARYLSSEAENILESEPYNSLTSRGLSLHEFFADVIAIARSGKPDSLMSKSLENDWEKFGFTSKEAGIREGKLRSFEKILERFQQGDGAHATYYISRVHVWKKYLSKPNISRAKIIKAVFGAVASEIEWLRNNSTIDPLNAKNCANLNRQLNKKIDLEFAALR